MSDQEKVVAPFTYNLTEMVGRRSNTDRTMIVASFEVQREHFWIFIKALPFALIVGLIFGVVIGVYGAIPFLLVIVGAFWLLGSNTTEGLQVKQWQALNDRRNAGAGKVFLCQREVDPLAIDFIHIKAGTVPISHSSPEHDTPTTRQPTRGRNTTRT